MLAQQPLLIRRRTPVETDWRLFVTLIRFDSVYYGHFKCNLRRIVDYPNLWGYLRDLYQFRDVASTVNFDHIKRHYYMTHRRVNPTRIVPIGPLLDLTSPHGRESLSTLRTGSTKGTSVLVHDDFAAELFDAVDVDQDRRRRSCLCRALVRPERCCSRSFADGRIGDDARGPVEAESRRRRTGFLSSSPQLR